MESVMPLIISDYQTGFYKGKMLILQHKKASQRHPLSIFLLRLRGNNISWRREGLRQGGVGLSTIFLRQFGFNTNLISWVRLLYSPPCASVCTNIERSTLFPLFQGTRQGCPLSLLLFVLAIEPLSAALKMEGGFGRINRWGIKHQVPLYGDDLLLYVSDPLSSIPCILTLLNSFGGLSGYKLNISKSEYFPINQLAVDISTISFKIASTGFKARVYNPGELARELARFESGTSYNFHPPLHPVTVPSKATPPQTWTCIC